MRAWPILALASFACGAPTPAPERTPVPSRASAPRPRPPAPTPSHVHAAAEDDAAPSGPACSSSLDCSGDLQCRGPVGCEAQWACGLARNCSGDHVAWCGCDGVTFYAPDACPGRLYAHRGPCESLGTQEDLSADAQDEAGICEASSDCRAGFECTGIEGCSTFWTCARRRRRCTRDSVPYCGCDGTTFQASSTCSGRPFAHRGACEDEGTAVASAPRPPPPPPPLSLPASSLATPSSGPESVPASGAGPASAPPRVCTSSRDCPRGHVCSGNEGCGMEWHCAPPASPCARDTQTFCGCDGRTFRASMTCPGQPHAHRGACAPTPASVLATPTPEPSGPRACARSADCPRGQACAGEEGCGMDWHCRRPPRPCVDDTQYFCGCDGRTFRASMTCPGQPHRHRGSCLPDERR